MKRIVTFLIMTGGCLMWHASLYAQHAYSLDECIGEALRNNVRIKNADNDLAAAQEARKSAFTNYFPSISATGGGFIADKGLLQMEMAPGENLSMVKDGLVGGVTATLPLFTGGQIVNGNKLAQVNVETNRLLRKQSEIVRQYREGCSRGHRLPLRIWQAYLRRR